MIGLTLAFTMAILGASAKASVDKAVEENFIGDYVVSSAFGEGFSPAITDRMAAVDGVTRWCGSGSPSSRGTATESSVTGVLPAQLSTFG